MARPQMGATYRQALGARWLTDTCTLESPDRTQASGWKTEATGAPCRVIEAGGGERVGFARALVDVQPARVHFLRSQALGVGWQITVTSQGNRTLKSATLVAPPEAPTQYVTASGTR